MWVAPGTWPWNNIFLPWGFRTHPSDTRLFILQKGNVYTYILVYVDDIILTGSSSEVVYRASQSLVDWFSIKDLIDLHYFLGIEVSWSSSGLHLMQRKYIFDILSKKQHARFKTGFDSASENSQTNITWWWSSSRRCSVSSTVDSLQYLVFTRPDISYAAVFLNLCINNGSLADG